ncbi:MAG: chromate efflux transporter [Cyclobacteriaceae bacterium]
MASVRKIRKIIFLKEVLFIAITAYGGPQAHIAIFIDFFVKKRGYLTEEELIELNALCQILPGPTSTQTITAIGYKIGGANLAYLTLLLWVLPAAIIMTSIALGITYLRDQNISTEFTRFIQPMAIGIIAYASYVISSKVIKTSLSKILMIFSVISALLISTFLGQSLIGTLFYPLVIIISGLITALLYKKDNKPTLQEKKTLNIQYDNLFLFFGVFILSVIIGNSMSNRSVLLFENFYRNGSLIFGGGQVLIPLLNAEFVDYKHYLTSAEFRSGIGFVQAVPGPVFSISSYIGCLSMRGAGTTGQIIGSMVSTLGIFLPGTFLIFFVIRFWERLKEYPIIKASIEGVNAASSGLIAAVAIILFLSLGVNYKSTLGLVDVTIVIASFFTLLLTKVRAPYLIISGLVMGLIWQFIL